MGTTVTGLSIAIVSKGVHGALREVGFRRKGNHLFRQSQDVFHGIHFQASQWNSADEGSFTVNLVVTSPIMYTCWTGRPFPTNPASALFPINQRLGLLMPDGTDTWWSVSWRTDANALAGEVAQAITDFGLPFLNQYPSTTAILSKARQGHALPVLTKAQQPLVHAMLAMEQGAAEEALEQIRIALDEAGSHPFRKTILGVASRLGLPDQCIH